MSIQTIGARYRTTSTFIHGVDCEFSADGACIEHERFGGYVGERQHVHVIVCAQHQHRRSRFDGESDWDVDSNRAGSRKGQ